MEAVCFALVEETEGRSLDELGVCVLLFHLQIRTICLEIYS